MLHSLRPDTYVEPKNLHGRWHCCNCQNDFVFGNGFVFLSHYREKETGNVGVGLMCFCSTECGLQFEDGAYMGKA